MEYKVLLTVFTTVFIAELGDKTQLATMLFAADKDVSKLTVLAGAAISGFVSERALQKVAGAGFIAIGLWTFFSH